MIIKIKNNGYLIYNKIKIKCAIGKSGLKLKKREGDKATPKGIFKFGKLYYRRDRIKKIITTLQKKVITKYTGWCHDPRSKFYNKETKYSSVKFTERLFRHDHKYDLVLVINYNINPTIPGNGSAIFLHLTKNFKPTKGCIAILKKDFLNILKLINTKSKIKIN